ncbi:MAG: hypothetical protein WB866_09235 [Solirubrobacterales bacterium]
MTTHPWLVGPEAKLDRAIEHLETVKEACERFLKTQPFTVSTEFESEADCYVARFRQRREMPIAVGVIVGEVVHDLRSALEHVAWLLATAHADDPAKLWEKGTREKITFPVAKKREHFDSHSLMEFISVPAQRVLDELQPHTRGNPYQVERHPLAALHDFWNVDKHRVVHGGIGEFDLSTTVSWTPMAIDVDELLNADVHVAPLDPLTVGGQLSDGDAIAHVTFRGLENPPGTTKVEMAGQPTARILFRAGDRAVSAQGLEGLSAYVATVLNEVRPLMPSSR